MNVFVILCIAILLICFIGGTRKGMARIIYGMLAWIFVFWFVNFGTMYIQDYLLYNTELSQTINEQINENLNQKYKESEEKEKGSGVETLMKIIPKSARDEIESSKNLSISKFISSIADTFTDYAMKGISVMIAIVMSALIVAIIGKLLIAFDIIPGISGINRILGGVAGLIEAQFIVWILMVIADFFPTSVLGKMIIEAVDNNSIIGTLYDKNLLRLFI